MKTWFALIVHELRNARSSLLAAACLTIALLVILHATAGGPLQAATAMPLLWCLCTLQFASDSFATDLVSGRLALRAALPVSARALWFTKLAGFVASMALITSLGIASEVGWQALCGAKGSIQTFLLALPHPAPALQIFALIGAAGMSCSLVVESALVAMLLTTLVLGALAGLWYALEATVQLMGESFLHEHFGVTALLWTGLFLGIGFVAFTRAQRRLGDAALRVRIVLIGALAVTLGFAGTVAAASWHWTMYGLEDPNIQIFPPIASPDGRFIVFEAGPILPSRFNRLESVWIIDLETGEQRLLAGPGFLVRNFYSGGWSAWSETDGLRVIAHDKWNWSRAGKGMTLRVVGGELREDPLEGVDAESLSIRKLPEWASVTDTQLKPPGAHRLRIQWKGTALERTLEGRIGYDVAISPTPGCVFVRRDHRLVWIDFSREAELALIPEGVVHMQLSPDAKALLVRTETATQVLSTDDGRLLHEPWPNGERAVGWIPGDDRSHELWIGPTIRGGKLVGKSRILDLEHGCEFEFASDFDFADCRGPAARIADRGYVQVDQHQDLVWIDREGKLVRVLVKRSKP